MLKIIFISFILLMDFGWESGRHRKIKHPFIGCCCISDVFSVCLQEGETFTKTSCYHYFHCHCLGRYASHSESELRQREKELEEDKTRDRTDYQVRRVLLKEIVWRLSVLAV